MEYKILFDYHYEEEAERYAFFRIPKALYTEPMFRELSDGAKVLYGQLLDLMSLSRKNGWTDELGRVFIKCGIAKIKEIMGCSNDKAVNMLKELDIITGVGLIEKVKRGNMATIIYVKSFIIMKNRTELQFEIKEEKTNENSDSEKQNTCSLADQFQNSDNPNSKNKKSRRSEFRKAEYKNSGKQKTVIPQNRKLEFCKSDTNNINNINTNLLINNSINQSERNDNVDMNLFSRFTKEIKQNIDYDNLMLRDNINERELIEDMLNIIVDFVSVKRKIVIIENNEYPYERVREMFFKLNKFHIEYVLDKVIRYHKKITAEVGFVITALYNSVKSINIHYYSKVNYDNGQGFNNELL